MPSGTKILLAQASTREESSGDPKETGGRVFLFPHTDNFWLIARGKKFARAPREEQNEPAAGFENLYGNK